MFRKETKTAKVGEPFLFLMKHECSFPDGESPGLFHGKGVCGMRCNNLYFSPLGFWYARYSETRFAT